MDRHTRLLSEVEFLVLHRAEMDVGAPDWFSYTWYIRRTGVLVELNPLTVVTPHAKDWNRRSIGIAVEGCFCSKEKALHNFLSGPQRKALPMAISSLYATLGLVLPVAGHSELGPTGTAFPEKLIAGHDCPGDLFQLDALRAVYGWPKFDLAKYSHG